MIAPTLAGRGLDVAEPRDAEHRRRERQVGWLESPGMAIDLQHITDCANAAAGRGAAVVGAIKSLAGNVRGREALRASGLRVASERSWTAVFDALFADYVAVTGHTAAR